MDISYLLALQDFREATGNVFTPFMLLVSELVPLLLVVPALIYWCIDKHSGSYILLNFTGSELVNNAIKCTVCCYRPWVRDARVKPVEGAVRHATGYSFPSGHAQISASVLGSIGYWKWRQKRWLSVICFAAVIFAAFSRNYLGVHTLQDVIVAIAESAAVILINLRLVPWILSGSKRRQNSAILAGTMAAAAVIIFISLKPYPMDYVNGGLLVDPDVMMTDAFGAAGDFLGFLAGIWVEKTFVHFVTDGTRRQKILRFIIGIIPFGVLYFIATPGLCMMAGDHFGTLIGRFLTFFYCLAVWPFIFRVIQKRKHH